ncbi:MULTISPECIES: hypothetical protein [Pseudomonadaceae]|jgi:KDO transferase-3|uniref:hypothetical protein n=1 Tax=Pseudomonadaceae TaxID=135621 RepID=UPI0005C9BE6F|nr:MULTISPECIES: hypothetical protein [Pseudomonas]MBO2925858.1 lipopolysaccharide core biosynthesis protein [Pseudomonas otitidis]
MLAVKVVAGERWLADDYGRQVARLRSFSEIIGGLGVDAFIVASGPSTKSFDFKRYRSYSFISMNGSISAFEDEDVKPFIYMCDDASFVCDRPELILRGVNYSKHIAASLEVLSGIYNISPDALKGKSIFLLERVNRFIGRKPLSDRAYAWSIRHDPDLICGLSLIRRSPNRIGFSLNMDKGYFVARTIPYVALQLSYHLGVRRVYLVGVDLDGAMGRFYESGEEAVRTSLHQDYDKFIEPSFEWMSRKIVRKGRYEVYNLSIASKLPSEIVPKLAQCDLDALLGII